MMRAKDTTRVWNISEAALNGLPVPPAYAMDAGCCRNLIRNGIFLHFIAFFSHFTHISAHRIWIVSK